MKAALVVGLLMVLGTLTRSLAQETSLTVAVSGYGLLGNRELRQMLDLVMPDPKPAYFDATFVEDAALVLLSRLTRDGFLQARVTARMQLADGSHLVQVWDRSLGEFLPRPLRVKRLHLIVHEGVLFYYDQLRFLGLRQMREAVAREYFIDTDFLLPLRSARVFTPARLEQALASLRAAYERLGYVDVRVRVDRLERNEQTGAVKVDVAVDEGRRHLVRSVLVEVRGSELQLPKLERILVPRRPYSAPWQQDLLQQLRTAQYRQGYPEATASLKIRRRELVGDQVQLDLLAEVRTGPRVRVGAVEFVGNQHTRTSVLERRIKVGEGEPLDRIAVERGRFALSRLGIFDLVQVDYEEETAQSWDVIYQVQEGKRLSLSLMAGFGSYELLRGGLVLEQKNLFGRAHSSRLQLTQSFKSSSGEYLYTIPELIGEQINVFVDAAGLVREEVSFTREEYSVSLGAQHRLRAIETDASLRYKYQLVTASDVPQQAESVRQARVGALTLDLRHDRLDDPLLPRRGYKLAGNFEVASVLLGGEVDYQRLELDSAAHWRVGRGQYLHLGISHGLAWTLGGADRELPFNKRFFPGGESSVRGFQQGEAAPRAENGAVLGAATFTQGNLEFEQMLTRAWSLVVFADAVGFAEEVEDYPVAEALVSVGGGIRFRTIVGPVRLEYGHNLNPRRHDPSGTLHFSLGFPF